MFNHESYNVGNKYNLPIVIVKYTSRNRTVNIIYNRDKITINKIKYYFTYYNTH